MINYCLPFLQRWWLTLILGTIICAGITPLIGNLVARPIYEAKTILVITITSPSSYDPPSHPQLDIIDQLLTSDNVLQSVASRHGLTTQQLKAMIHTQPQADMGAIQVNLDNENPILATQLSYEVTKAFVNFALAQGVPLTWLSIIKPSIPTKPLPFHPEQYAFPGILIGFCLTLMMITLHNYWMVRHQHRGSHT